MARWPLISGVSTERSQRMATQSEAIRRSSTDTKRPRANKECTREKFPHLAILDRDIESRKILPKDRTLPTVPGRANSGLSLVHCESGKTGATLPGQWTERALKA